MKEVKGDIWGYGADCVVITTNGTVKSNGECVMGRGLALQAKTRFPGLAKRIGGAIREWGNHVYMMGGLCTFPVKQAWWEKADLGLIRRSAAELSRVAFESPDLVFAVPRPGCQNGGRTWDEVRPIIESVLPDNVHIVDLQS